MPLKSIREAVSRFIRLESAGGILLFVMAVLAIIIENSPWKLSYNLILETPLGFNLGSFIFTKSLQHWINDGLMVIFFLLVGLEIKREFLIGELSTFNKAILPGIAAVGGMVVPALIYTALNHDHPGNAMRGWAIPTATDIAFALGVLSVLGKRIPPSIKIFLTALAILDDLGAILIIAIFYTDKIYFLALGIAAICLLILFLLNRYRIMTLTPYLLVGIILWIAVLKSGVHATLAGVALAMAIPLRDPHDHEVSPLDNLEHTILPWVAFFIMPLFAFANAGVSLAGVHAESLLHSISLGITLGLFIGKQIGVFGLSWLFIKLGIAQKPKNATFLQLYGASLLCGIGFTMSLFIGGLAFGNYQEYITLVRIGVFSGSILSGVVGYLILYFFSRSRQAIH
ncbi:MAG: Na+/H+ antiporter NhaA [Legionellales bacterium]|nr:Na+/H+ antiporter NhaA [Legionellales bacterium]